MNVTNFFFVKTASKSRWSKSEINFKTWLVLVALVSSPVCAFYENHLSNVFSPIPPGCVTNFQVWNQFNTSGTQTLAEGVVDWPNINGAKQQLEVKVMQKGCPDSGRRVLFLEVRLLNNSDGVVDAAFPPFPWGRIQGDATRYRFRLNTEPNTNFASDQLTGWIGEGVVYRYFLDNYAPLAGDFDPYIVMTIPKYNGAFTLELDDRLNSTVSASVPAYANNLRATTMILNGRLTGNWVTPGVRDQGFLLSFNELFTEAKGLLFMSWYTYDSNGDLLWLTGANTYELESTQASFDIELVTNGEFLGSKVADREVVGTGTIRAYDCNDLRLTYNLNGIGLGSGTIQLRRVFSLEIQGYVCGDPLTREQHLNDGH